uniref:Vitellogenin domain-containing protein n=1 Tax=Phlebotomus papatasi TaxID=29031 RepID=A0A1B0GLZ6_PHLPP
KIFWSPVEGKSLVHFLQTSYKFNFVEESTLSVDDTDFDFESEKNLELVTSNPNEAENVVNLKSMENINSETLISYVRDRLKDISFIWEKSRISSTRHDQLVGRELTEIISVMELFKFQQFYDLWILLSNDTSVEASKELDIFYKIVPYIGTEECVLFIKKLIILKEVGNNLMEKMLTKLAGSIRQPTPKVAEALKEVWDSNKNVNAALLAYTSALGAGFRTNPAVFHDLMEQAKKDLFTKISESSSNFNNQRLYYQALGNLNCISLADDNVIKLRSLMFNNDMLMHLILALEKSTDGQYVFDLMLKILRDVSKSSELRAVALRIALKRMPSYDQYETLARVMDEDTNYELYNLFESSVRAFVKVKELPESALLWLRNREPMSRSMAFAYESPEDYPLAFSVRGYLFFNDLTWGLQQIHFDVYQKYGDLEMLIQHADIDVIPYPISQDLILFHSDFGYKYHMQVFGYNAPPNNKEFPESLDEMMYKKPFSDVFKDSDEEFLVSLLSYINWNFLAHSAYSYNFKATIEPSDVFPITKYALSVGPSQEYLIEFKDKDDNVRVYYKLSTKRNIYSYIQLLRMGLGLKSSGICFGHIVDESDESMYHLTYGTDSGDLFECPMDQFSLSVRFKSDFSFEQIENHNNERLTYVECSHTSPYLQSKDPTNNHGCGRAASTFRNMDVKLSYENIPKKLMKYINQIWTWFLKTNNGNSLTNHVSIQSSTDITVKAFYPMTEPFLNLDVILSEQTYSFKLPPTLLTPDNLGISDFFYVSDFIFPAPYCVLVVTENRLKSSRHYLHSDSSSWTEYANINLVKIYVKKVSKDKLALKIEYPKTEVTVYPKINSTSFEKYDITLGEKGIDLVPINWAHRRTQSVTVLDTIFFVPEASKEENHFMIGYNGHSITIFGSYNADQNYGKCFGFQAVNVERETDYETCDNFI